MTSNHRTATILLALGLAGGLAQAFSAPAEPAEPIADRAAGPRSAVPAVCNASLSDAPDPVLLARLRTAAGCPRR